MFANEAKIRGKMTTKESCEMRPGQHCKLGSKDVLKTEKGRDLGVIVNNKLSPEDHIHDKVRSMRSLLGNIRVAFPYVVDADMVHKTI